ncbi:MAG: methyltransferase domain-containing protein [Clostridium sp.]
MDAYAVFAEVYDMFMDNIPYEDWCGYLTSLLKEYGINDGLVLDLGCGTGTLTEVLAKEGYDMIGVDVSEDMLQKRSKNGQNPAANFIYCRICANLNCTGRSGRWWVFAIR